MHFTSHHPIALHFILYHLTVPYIFIYFHVSSGRVLQHQTFQTDVLRALDVRVLVGLEGRERPQQDAKDRGESCHQLLG